MLMIYPDVYRNKAMFVPLLEAALDMLEVC